MNWPTDADIERERIRALDKINEDMANMTERPEAWQPFYDAQVERMTAKSDPVRGPLFNAAWDALMAPQFARLRSKTSIHELRTLIEVIVDAALAPQGEKTK